MAKERRKLCKIKATILLSNASWAWLLYKENHLGLKSIFIGKLPGSVEMMERRKLILTA